MPRLASAETRTVLDHVRRDTFLELMMPRRQHEAIGRLASLQR